MSRGFIPLRMRSIPPLSKAVRTPQKSFLAWEGRRWGAAGQRVPGGLVWEGGLGEGMRTGRWEMFLPLVVEGDARGRDAESKKEKGFTSLFLRQKGSWVF